MNVTQIKGRALAIKSELGSIHARALTDGRDFTPAETSRVEELIGEARGLKARITEAKGQQELSDMVKDLGDAIGVPGSANRALTGRKAAAWGDAFVKGLPTSNFGAKELVPSGTITLPSLTGGIELTAEAPRRILQVIPRGPDLSGTDVFAYLQETVRTHNAAPVAPGARKPTSVYSLQKVEDRARTIAHLTEPIERQTLSDVEMLRAYIDEALRVGVELALEDQIVNGDGTGEELTGLAETDGIQTQAWDTDVFTTTRKAVTKLEDVAEIQGGIFLLNPNDWEVIDLKQDNEGRYYYGGPVDRAKRQLHSKPVITSTVVTAGTGYLVDFAGSTELREREGVRVDWSENVYDPDALGEGEGASDFERNMVRFRGEGRWGFAVKRPRGVVEIDLTA